MVTLHTVAESRLELLRVLFRVGNASKWYSRRGRENIGQVLEGTMEMGEGRIDRVWWLGNRLRLNCSGCTFSELIAGPAGDLTVHLAVNEEHTAEFSLIPNYSVGGGFINLDFPEQDFAPLNAVRFGDVVNLVIGDVV